MRLFGYTDKDALRVSVTQIHDFEGFRITPKPLPKIMSYENYDTERLIELYVSHEATIRDKRNSDLTAMSEQKKIGNILAERGVSETRIENEMEEKGLLN